METRVLLRILDFSCQDMFKLFDLSIFTWELQFNCIKKKNIQEKVRQDVIKWQRIVWLMVYWIIVEIKHFLISSCLGFSFKCLRDGFLLPSSSQNRLMTIYAQFLYLSTVPQCLCSKPTHVLIWSQYCLLGIYVFLNASILNQHSAKKISPP